MSLKRVIGASFFIIFFGFLGGTTALLGMRWLVCAMGLKIPEGIYYLVMAAGCVGGVLLFGVFCAFILSSSLSREEEMNSASFKEVNNNSN